MSKKEIDRIRRQVLSWQLPTAWVDLVVAALHASTARDLDGLEVFAGAKHLTAGCRSHGLLFETIEVEDGADQDVLTPAGLAKTISFLCRVKTRGLLWLGIPCSSWVFVGRSNAQRYFFHPEGNTNNEYTSRHNHLAEVGYRSFKVFCLRKAVPAEGWACARLCLYIKTASACTRQH